MVAEKLQERIGQESDRFAWGLVLFVAAAGGAIWLSLHVGDLGYRFKYLQPNMELDYAVGVLMWFGFAVGILIFGRDSRRMLLLAWVAKFFVVLVAMLFYEHHYGLDAGDYFDLKLSGRHWWYPGVDFREDLIPSFTPKYRMGTGLAEGYEPETLGGTSTTENFLRVLLLVTYFTPPSYHAMKVEFAFFGLLGVWFFYRAVVVAAGRPWPAVFYVLAFFPSILFWSSTLGKDPLQFLFMGLYAYGGALWFVEGRLRAILWIGMSLLVVYLIRPWSSVMGGAALILATVLGRGRPWQVGMMTLLTIPVLMLGIHQLVVFLEGRDLSLVLGFVESVRGVAEGYGMEGASGEKDVDLSSRDGLIASWPLAFFSGLFRPLPYDITNPFTALAALENTIVLVLAVVALFRFRLAYLRDPLVLWPFLYTVIWTNFYGFIVMVNFGSGVRYKIQMWPFFLLMLLSLTYSQGRAFLTSRLPARRADFRH